MTQEELNAVIDEELEDDLTVLEDEELLLEESEDIELEDSGDFVDDIDDESKEECVDCPPPPTQEHRVVSQLDDVTKDSEIKAGEIFDKLEEINGFVGDTEESVAKLSNIVNNNIKMLEKLCEKFPHIQTFQTALKENQEALIYSEKIVEKSQNTIDEIMMIMDIMQYQDIHRQKIERVISVMRALSKYMNSLFDSDIDDKKRTSTANHISGDGYEAVSEDEIEALLESFGKK